MATTKEERMVSDEEHGPHDLRGDGTERAHEVPGPGEATCASGQGEALKSAGATFDQRTKRWHIDRNHPNAEKKVLDFVQTSRSSVTKAKRVATEPLKIDPVTGQSRLDDDYFAIETKPERIIRKKVSLDMDVALHKQLKQIALENDVKLYELVEGVLRNYVEKKK